MVKQMASTNTSPSTRKHKILTNDSTAIKPDTINQVTHQDSTFKALQNIISSNPISNIALDREKYQSYQPPYNINITPPVKITNQRRSGRCWIFAALNMIRRPMMSLYNLKAFEFSQSYLFFWDKLEKMNYALEAVLDTKDLPMDSRMVHFLMKDPLGDGGQWSMFVNLVEKYGLVPKSEYRESYHSSNSHGMNQILKRKFREYAIKLRDSETPKALKQTFMAETYHLLCKFLGTPPNRFKWSYTDEKRKVHTLPETTPLEFYRQKVPFKCEDFVCLINDPRNPYEKIYTVKYLGNVVEGKPVRYLNLPIKKLKAYSLKALKRNQSVWFGCDVMQWFNKKECAMDLELVNFKDLFDISFSMDKAERLETCESLNTHAMLFSGVRTDNEPGEDEKIVNWQVENSWSAKGPKKGFYCMSDPWFDEYVYQVVVPVTYLSREEQRSLLKDKAITLEPWDPMGALA